MPAYLYHGSAHRIRARYLRPHRPRDTSQKENALHGVYASDKKDIAIGMALANQKDARSFADYSQTPFTVIFVKGRPQQRYVYVYTISAQGFGEQPAGSHQWVSHAPARILQRERYAVSDLDAYWRTATQAEKEWFYAAERNS